MTATVKAMDSQRWTCRIQLFQFNGTSFEDEPEPDRAYMHVRVDRLRPAPRARRRVVHEADDPRWHVDDMRHRPRPGPARTRPRFSSTRRASSGSWDPREQADELLAHHPPAVARAAECLFLVRLEARLHEGQARARRRGRERERHDRVQRGDAPRVAELPPRFDLDE